MSNIKNILFSIIVPAYNSAAYIKKCIESVIAQTYTDFELILVDDGSSDNTLQLCRSYADADSRIKIIHKENGGHTSARNEGLKNATGKYVVFLDSDDWLDPMTLELCMAEIKKNNPDVIIFRLKNSTEAAPFRVSAPDGFYNMPKLKPLINSALICGADGKAVFPKSLSGKCFRKDIIYESQMTVPKSILIGEDGAAFSIAMLKSESISVIAGDCRACYNCFVRANSVSRTSDNHAFGKATILLGYYKSALHGHTDLYEQFRRDVVAQIYTAALYVIRSGEKTDKLNAGLDSVLAIPEISDAFYASKFNLKGYKFIIKKFILRHRLWKLAKLIDR